MVLRRGAPKRPPVDVVDVGKRPVQILRAFEWVATALRTFRERPLPGSYSTEAIPTFDLFGSSKLEDFQVEEILGDLASIEVLGPRVATDKYRIYLSVDVFHDDAVAHKMLFSRVVPDPVLGFPIVVFATAAGVVANEHVAVQNILIPPDGRIETLASLPASMGAASRITMRNMFIEMAIGEPSGELIGG